MIILMRRHGWAQLGMLCVHLIICISFQAKRLLLFLVTSLAKTIRIPHVEASKRAQILAFEAHQIFPPAA